MHVQRDGLNGFFTDALGSGDDRIEGDVLYLFIFKLPSQLDTMLEAEWSVIKTFKLRRETEIKKDIGVNFTMTAKDRSLNI